MEDAEMTVVICRRELALAKKAVWAERLRQGICICISTLFLFHLVEPVFKRNIVL